MPRLLISVMLIALFAGPASASFRITPEQGISAPSTAPAEGRNTPAAIGSDGDRFVVFWINYGILSATSIAQDGQVEGTVAIPTSSSVDDLSVCWTGSSYLATWQQGSDVYAATLARDGGILSPAHVIARDARTRSGGLASNGRRAFVAYTALPSIVVTGALLDLNANVVASDLPLPITDIASNLIGEIVPLVSSDGNDFAVVWRSGELVPIPPSALSDPPPLAELFHDFHLLRLSDSGAVIGDRIDLGRTEQAGDLGIAFGGGVYAVVTNESHLIKPAEAQQRVVRFIVDPKSGIVTKLPLLDVAGGTVVSVLWNGSRFIAYWMLYSQTFSQLDTLRFSGSPESDSPPVAEPMTAPHLAQSPILVSNGRQVFGAWTEYTSDLCCVLSDVLGTFLDADAVTASDSPLLVSAGWSRQFSPSIATSGSDSLVTWIDGYDNGETGALVGVRIGANGALIDRVPFEIAPAVALYSKPAVVFAGQSYLVFWSESLKSNGSSSVIARSVGRDGSLGARLRLGAGYSVSAASNGSTALVAFTGATQVVACRFTASGSPIDTTPLVIGAGGGPQVASNGTDFFVAWNVGSDFWQFPSPDLVDVFGARVTAAGSVDASPLPIATGPADQILSAIGSDGRDYLVVYQLFIAMNQTRVLTAKRVLREGQLDGAASSDEGAIVASVNLETSFSSVSIVHESGYWIGWTQSEPGTDSIMLVHTDVQGNPATPITLTSSGTSLRSAAISLAQAPGSALQIAYSRRITEGAYVPTSRVFVRLAGDFASRSRIANH